MRFLRYSAGFNKKHIHMSINAKDRKAADEGKLRLRLRCYGGVVKGESRERANSNLAQGNEKATEFQAIRP